MVPLIITGFMGAGKSSVGKLLSDRLQIPFWDTDAEIERRSGLSVAAYIRRFDWPAFRRFEKRVLHELLGLGASSVIATGGGIVEDAGSRWQMLQSGFVAWLDVPFAQLLPRLLAQSGRPLVDAAPSPEELKRLYLSRLPFYRQCHFSLDNSGGFESVVEKILYRYSFYCSRMAGDRFGSIPPELVERGDGPQIGQAPQIKIK